MTITLPEILVSGAAVYCLITGIQSSLRVRASRSWPSVQGKIICSEVDGKWERDGGKNLSFSYMYSPVIRYEYFVDGRRREGNQVSYKSFSCTIKSMVADPEIKFPIGKEVEVFYDPKNPDDSLLAGARPPSWVLLLPFIFSAVLVILVLTGVVGKWKLFD